MQITLVTACGCSRIIETEMDGAPSRYFDVPIYKRALPWNSTEIRDMDTVAHQDIQFRRFELIDWDGERRPVYREVF